MNPRLEHLLSRLAGRAKYQATDRRLLQFHADVLRCAGASRTALMRVLNASAKELLSFAALHVIDSDIESMGMVVFALCRQGWAYACPLVLRTQLDLLLSAGAIANAGANAEYMGFKYLFVASNQFLHAGGIPKAQKARERAQVREFLQKLNTEDQKRALKFIRRSRRPGYWYAPEFSNPRAVIAAISSPATQEVYDWLSGAAHGGMMSLRAWRDTPDDNIPRPRADAASQNRALAFTGRLMLDFVQLRAGFLGFPQTPCEQRLRREFAALQPIVDESFAAAMVKAKVFAEHLVAQRQATRRAE